MTYTQLDPTTEYYLETVFFLCELGLFSQDEALYEVSSEVRGQLKVLESIDRMNHRRKMEREKDQILRAAKSRSRAEDPEAAAKIKEQAKKVCQWPYSTGGL